MPFIGNKPTAVPLTSADIADSIITSAKIVDGTIVNADINASAGIDASKLTGISSDYVLLATTIASSVASVSFDGFFSSTYTNYEVIISDVRPVSANVRLYSRLRRSNADVTASNYSSAGRRTYEVKSASDANDGRFSDNAAEFDILTNSSPASSSRTTGSKIIIYNPLSTTSYKKVDFQSIGPSDDAGGTFGLWNVNQAGQLTDNTNALSGISFFYDSGNISEGVFKLYGIK